MGEAKNISGINERRIKVFPTAVFLFFPFGMRYETGSEGFSNPTLY